jgi:hypothetical protein
VVCAYDVRPAVKEQIESLGAKFVSMDLDTAKAEGAGGYAQAADEDFYRRQRELTASVLKDQDVVITTAAIPGRKAPILITREMLRGMSPGSVIVDLAAERGGNCEATQPGKTVVAEGVTVIGPLNLTSSVPYHASQMYARNIAALLKHLVKDGQLTIDPNDEITRETLVARAGAVVHPKLVGLSALFQPGFNHFAGVLAGHHGNDLQRCTAATPVEDPFLELPQVAALHQLKTAAEIRLHPAIHIGQTFGHSPAFIAHAPVSGEHVVVFKTLNHHEQHKQLSHPRVKKRFLTSHPRC